jgi:hypothetical protein
MLCALLASGCAARVVGFGDGAPSGDGRGDGGSMDPGDDAGDDVRYRDVPVTYDVYREDACAPESGDAVRMYDCDPFDQASSGCAAGEACYPYIDYPMGPCGHEVYRATCEPAGTGAVDAFCGLGGQQCAAGLGCFVTGSGDRCLALCRLDGSPPQCPRGRVCEPTDLPDFGACD